VPWPEDREIQFIFSPTAAHWPFWRRSWPALTRVADLTPASWQDQARHDEVGGRQPARADRSVT